MHAEAGCHILTSPPLRQEVTMPTDPFKQKWGLDNPFTCMGVVVIGVGILAALVGLTLRVCARAAPANDSKTGWLEKMVGERMDRVRLYHATVEVGARFLAHVAFNLQLFVGTALAAEGDDDIVPLVPAATAPARAPVRPGAPPPTPQPSGAASRRPFIDSRWPCSQMEVFSTWSFP
jgi:hypothetical protein